MVAPHRGDFAAQKVEAPPQKKKKNKKDEHTIAKHTIVKRTHVRVCAFLLHREYVIVQPIGEDADEQAIIQEKEEVDDSTEGVLIFVLLLLRGKKTKGFKIPFDNSTPSIDLDARRKVWMWVVTTA